MLSFPLSFVFSSLLQDLLRGLSLEEVPQGAEVVFGAGEGLEQDAFLGLEDEDLVPDAEFLPEVLRDGRLPLAGNADDPRHYFHLSNTIFLGITLTFLPSRSEGFGRRRDRSIEVQGGGGVVGVEEGWVRSNCRRRWCRSPGGASGGQLPLCPESFYAICSACFLSSSKVFSVLNAPCSVLRGSGGRRIILRWSPAFMTRTFFPSSGILAFF